MKGRGVSIAAMVIALLSIGIGRSVAGSGVTSADIVDRTIQSRDMATGSVDSRVVLNRSLSHSDLSVEALRMLQSYQAISGVTLRGVIGGDFEVQPGTNCPDNCDFGGYASLPVPGKDKLGDVDVLVDNESWATGGGQTLPALDASEAGSNAACTGTPAAPTAPAGKVCIYIAGGDNAVGVKGVSVLPGVGESPFGFKIVWVAPNQDDTFIDAVWAYTAS
jgi:hypothetical protein